MKLILIAAAASAVFVTGALASAPTTTKTSVETSISQSGAKATIVAFGPSRSNARSVSGGRSAFGG